MFLIIIVWYIDYFINIMGEDYVVFGLDFDGIILLDELGDVVGLLWFINMLCVSGYD